MNPIIPEHIEEKINSFRPLPFWSWNGDLEPERLREQVREMAKVGLGGFFMHARMGLVTPYMGEEWMSCVAACIGEAEQLGIRAWGYDENGYPSGIAGGVVTQTEEYCSSWLEFVPFANLDNTSDRILATYSMREGKYHLCDDGAKADMAAVLKSEIRASDVLNPDAVDLFIDLTHEAYHKAFPDKMGGTFPGFFTDEPQLKMYQLPWTKNLDILFRKTYGYDLWPELPSLAFDQGSYTRVRYDFWRLINKLYCEVFGKKTYDWCESRGLQMTGHVMGEDSLLEQMASTGGVMPYYEYLHIPGMDWLKRRIGSPVVPKQVASVAAQLDRRQVLSETFALSGWDVSFEELKWIAQWQFVCGINLLCPHLESYSLKGMRKRDYPPSLFVHQNWWDSYRVLNDHFAAVGATLAEGQEDCDVLIIHPLFSAYPAYRGKSDNPFIKQLDADFTALSQTLSDSVIPYHYGDETIMERHGSVESARIKIGKTSYSKVILPGLTNLSSFTYRLLRSFCDQGGLLYTTGDLPIMVDGVPDPRPAVLPARKLEPQDYKKELDDGIYAVHLSENGEPPKGVWIQKRRRDYGVLIYIVNNNLHQSRKLCMTVNGADALCAYDPLTDTYTPLQTEASDRGAVLNLELEGGGSLFVATRKGICESPKQTSGTPENRVLIPLPQQMNIADPPLNTMTLDRCDYRVDGGRWTEDLPVYKIQRRLLDLQKPCDVTLRFMFQSEILPKELYLIVEDAEEYRITVNGENILFKEAGSFIDPCFKKVDIAALARIGENEILLDRRFWQREELIQFLYRPKDLSSNFYDVDFDFEAVTYDVELESIYLLGDFCVKSGSPYIAGERRSLTTQGPFVLTARQDTVRTGDLTTQGYPFFTGIMKLEWEETLNPVPGHRYLLDMKKPHCPVAKLYVNGQFVSLLAYAPLNLDVTDFLRDGVNHFTLELQSSHRNLFGPHHFIGGESYSVGVSTFTDTPTWNEDMTGNIWQDAYCFVRFGLDTSDSDTGKDEFSC